MHTESNFLHPSSASSTGAARFGLAVAVAALLALLVGFPVWRLGSLLPIPEIPVGDFHPALSREMRPEPQENFTFIVMCLLAPLIAFAAVRIARRCPARRLPPDWTCWIALPLFLQCILPGDFLADYFEPVYRLPVLAATVVLSIALLELLRRRNRPGGRSESIAIAVIVLLPLLSILFSRVYTMHNLHRLSLHNLEIITYAVSQAAAGGSDLHQYGFYPYFLSPLFLLCGTGVFALSVVMGALFWAGCVFLFLSVRRYGTSFFTAGAALFFFACLLKFLPDEDIFDPYFAYYPVRFFFPALAVALFVYGERNRRRYPRIDAAYGVWAALSLFWNPDSGLAVTGAFVFLTFLKALRGGTAGRRAAVRFAAGLLGSLALTWLLLSLRLGMAPTPTQIFAVNRHFYQVGFMMLPMPPLPALWSLVALLYLSGLTLGAYYFLAGRAPRFGQLAVFLSVLGLGLFLYYQGRSHDYNLYSAMWPAALLFFLAAGRIMRGRRKSWRTLSLPLLAVLLMVMGAGSLLWQLSKIGRGLAELGRGLTADGMSPMEENTRFILEHAKGRVVNISGYGQGVYYAESGLLAGIPKFGRIEIIDNHNIDAIRRALLQSDAPLFVTAASESDLYFIGPILPAFRIVARSPNGSMFLLEKITPSGTPQRTD